MTIVAKDNQIQESEPAIQQFIYDLYLTLLLCPKRLKAWESCDQSTKPGYWSLDPIRFNQWCQLTQRRIDKGQCLQVKNGQDKVLERIVAALDETFTLSLPPPEKAALFLLYLYEEQFLNPLRQEKFIQQFFSENEHTYFTNDFEEMNVAFL